MHQYRIPTTYRRHGSNIPSECHGFLKSSFYMSDQLKITLKNTSLLFKPIEKKSSKPDHYFH